MSSIPEGVANEDKKMKLIQINLNHCEAAQDLLHQTIREIGADVAILSEQYKTYDNNSWAADSSNRAAIWACGKLSLQENSGGAESGFVRGMIDGIHIYSCYAHPSATIDEFQIFLDRLISDARSRNPLLIAGDFNAWAVEWGSRETNNRGKILLEAFSLLSVVILNVGNTPTFCRGNASSVVDLTWISEGVLAKVRNWRVSELYTHSDHQAIMYEILDEKLQSGRMKLSRSFIGWKHKMLDSKFLTFMLENKVVSGPAEVKVTQIINHLTSACDAAMPRRFSISHKKSVYWWTEEIAELRKKCLRARRLYQRAKPEARIDLRQRYCEARAVLKFAIKATKQRCFKELCEEVNRDPWGRPYRTVITKLKGSFVACPSCPRRLESIIGTLFPQQPVWTVNVEPKGEGELIPPVTIEEVLKACGKVKSNKAPGPDKIPNIALTTAVRSYPELFVSVYNACLEEGVFPKQWKIQRLVLLPKGKKDLNDPSSYRPICLLDTAGKILERIICERLQGAIESKGGLADNQYGFRKARSTIDAIKLVVDTARDAIAGDRWKGGSKKYCAVVTLDVKNAFNSARWQCILEALLKFGVPAYLIRLVADYFRRRILRYDTDAGTKEHPITGGVPQGSVLAPTLWNVMYDGIFKLPIPEEAKIVGFADDAALIVVAKHREEVVQICNWSIKVIHEWLNNMGLQLAEQKTEVILITSRKQMEDIAIEVGGQQIISKPYINYLGVIIDARLSFRIHLDTVSEKARRVNGALSRLMPNVGGASQKRRLLLGNVITSILMYGAPIWASASEVCTYRQKVASVYRLCALRVISAFRTVSEEAVCLIAGMPPIDLIAKERRNMYFRREDLSKRDSRIMAHEETISEWQHQWDNTEKGRWTHQLIPSVDRWVNRDHGEVNFYLSQFLTGHGCFRAYLFKFKREDSPYCPMCEGKIENVEHVFFECPRFNEERCDLLRSLGVGRLPLTIVDSMLDSEDTWKMVSDMSAGIMKKLRCLERERQIS